MLVFLFLPFIAYGQKNQSAENKPKSDSASESYIIKTNILTLKTALHLTGLARAKAASLNKNVSIAILDAGGQTIVLTRGDGVGVHNIEAARRKAFTAVSTKTATLIMGRNAKANPDTQNLANLPELLLLGGGVPIYYQNEVIGSIGVAGGGSAENDDLIARSASIPEAAITAK